MRSQDSGGETAAAFAVKSYPQPSHDKVCLHEVSNCFKLIGYPKNWGTRGGYRGCGRGPDGGVGRMETARG